jgi:hypothetical protein
LTTLHFADEVIITAPEDSAKKKTMLQLHKTALTYNLAISTIKTKTPALKGKELIKAKIIINNTITEQFTNFNYLECQFGSNRNYYLPKKLQRFNHPCRTTKHRTKLNARQT